MKPRTTTAGSFTFALASRTTSGLTVRFVVTESLENPVPSDKFRLLSSSSYRDNNNNSRSTEEIETHQLSLLSAGTFYVIAYQDGNETVSAAPSFVQEITLPKQPQTIQFPKSQFTATPSWKPGLYWRVTAASTSGLSVRFTVSDSEEEAMTHTPSSRVLLTLLPDDSSVSLTILSAGTYYITAYQDGNDLFLPANSITHSFRVEHQRLANGHIHRRSQILRCSCHLSAKATPTPSFPREVGTWQFL